MFVVRARDEIFDWCYYYPNGTWDIFVDQCKVFDTTMEAGRVINSNPSPFNKLEPHIVPLTKAIKEQNGPF